MQITRSGNDTDSESGSRTVEHLKGGEDTFTKGVKTTSSQETSNTGDKLGRNTPNEKLAVVGESTTTVEDSGSDTTQYGGTINITETPNLSKTKTFNSGVHTEITDNNEKLSIEDIKVLQAMRSIYKEFALLFENLFLGVID